jgi:hypothetical protein
MHGELKLIRTVVALKDEAAVAQYQKMAAGEAEADATGAEVLAFLRDAVMAQAKG